ncbi:MAG: RNA polymerase sigma factor [Cyclobacteriaceae bacterium]|jgi:RNA polymerase sigma-70 factor (ECF subfamily)|nr:RNA polymerase sigma factor [Cyclobacteriaceae bacterium]
MMDADQTLKRAVNGDINAFQALFADFQNQLKSYLYRLVTDRNDAEDLTHDTFVRAFDKIGTFRGESSLKTWVFQIATHLAYNHLRQYKRWQPDAQDRAKALALSNQEVYDAIIQAGRAAGEGAYDMREHIDFCFTCISKTLPIEGQVALILKEVYDFTVREVSQIIGQTEGVIKHLLLDSRKTMTTVFEHRCALINKEGVCHQCSELNGVHNPKQNQQEALMKLELVKESAKYDKEALFELRVRLVKNMDPLRSRGAELQDVIMKCTRQAIGEIERMN